MMAHQEKFSRTDGKFTVVSRSATTNLEVHLKKL